MASDGLGGEREWRDRDRDRDRHGSHDGSGGGHEGGRRWEAEEQREEGEVGPGHDSAPAAPFATPVGWTTVDRAGIMRARRCGPGWLHKEIAEFLGEPEEALLTLVLEISVAEPVLEELELALEDDAMTQWCWWWRSRQ